MPSSTKNLSHGNAFPFHSAISHKWARRSIKRDSAITSASMRARAACRAARGRLRSFDKARSWERESRPLRDHGERAEGGRRGSSAGLAGAGFPVAVVGSSES